MATQADVRRIALALPATTEAKDKFAFSVDHPDGKSKGFAWVWQERIEPKKPRIPNPAVLAIRTRNADDKATLLAADPDKFFTEPHYNGFPAVLVRLANITVPELRKLLADGWRAQAPKSLLASDTDEPTRRRRTARSTTSKKKASKVSKRRR